MCPISWLDFTKRCVWIFITVGVALEMSHVPKKNMSADNWHGLGWSGQAVKYSYLTFYYSPYLQCNQLWYYRGRWCDCTCTKLKKMIFSCYLDWKFKQHCWCWPKHCPWHCLTLLVTVIHVTNKPLLRKYLMHWNGWQSGLVLWRMTIQNANSVFLYMLQFCYKQTNWIVVCVQTTCEPERTEIV